jgi:hypothetical protein
MGTKISQMANAATLTGAEHVPIVQSGGNAKATLTSIKQLVNAAGAEITLTPAASVGWDITLSRKARLTLDQDTALDITNMVAGDFGQLILLAGAFTFYFPAGSKVPAGLALVNDCVLGFYYDGTNFWWSADVDYEPAAAAPSQTYITWHTINVNLEVYNSSKGIRRNGTGGDGWGHVAYSNETLDSGEALYVQISGTNRARMVGLHSARANQGDVAPGWLFGVYIQNTGVINSNESAVAGTQNIAYADLGWVRMTHTGSTILCEYSPDLSSWTTIKDEPGASGPYFIVLEGYEQATTNALPEIYKL